MTNLMILDEYYNDLGIFLYLIPIISAFWAAFVLFVKKDRTIPQLYLAISFVTLGFAMFFSFWYDRYASNGENNILRTINMIFTIFCLISVLFYFISLMRPDKLTAKYILTYITVGIVFSIILSLPAFTGHNESISGWNEVFRNITHPAILSRLIAVLLICTFEIIVFINVLKIYISHRKFIHETYSYGEEIDLNWILHSMILFSVFALFDLAWMVDSSLLTKATFNIIAVFVIIHVFLLGFRQGSVPVIEKETTEKETEQDDFIINNIQQTQLDILENQLLNYFETVKPFLNSKLSLIDISDALNTNRTYLSQLINRRFNTNFYALVNTYRIRHAQNLMKNVCELNVDHIADASGFKSRSVFYKQFKIVTGESPSIYLKNQKETEETAPQSIISNN